MTTLGIGARVWIGWAPQDKRHGTGDQCAARTGTIVEGPFPPGTIICVPGIGRFQSATNYWDVVIDGGPKCTAEESYLYPLHDDGETEADLARRGMAVET